MTIADQLEKKQPQIYNFLIDCFDLDIRKTARMEPAEEFADDDYEFRLYRNMMTEKSSAQK